MKEELKPCPFCGAQPRVIRNFKYDKKDKGECQIFCVCPPEPMVILKPEEFDKAAQQWNTRADEEETLLFCKKCKRRLPEPIYSKKIICIHCEEINEVRGEDT